MHALAASCEELRARTGNPPLAQADQQKFFKNIQKPCQTGPKQLLSINKNMF
jgi:hypothetical protein